MAGAGLSGALFFGCDGTYGENYINLAGPRRLRARTRPTFQFRNPKRFDLFREKYQSEFGDEQGALSPFSPHGHDSMALILNAIDQVAEVQGDGSLAIPRQALAETVRSTKNFPGLTGTITCSAKGECAAAAALCSS